MGLRAVGTPSILPVHSNFRHGVETIVTSYCSPAVPAMILSKAILLIILAFRSRDTNVIESVIYALFSIIKWPDGAEAVVSAGIPSILCELLERQSTRVKNGVCIMLGRLALLESTAPRVLLANPTGRLVSLLRCVSLRAVWRIQYLPYCQTQRQCSP
jgi:hypothetical protein